MPRRTCSCCGKTAIAYRIEADGSKTYLCEDHLPAGNAPHHGEAQQQQALLDRPQKPAS